jgi:hypothetical protein
VKRVVLTSTTSDSYDFFLPIAARVWRKMIGYEPLVFLVGTVEEWSVGHCGAVTRHLRGDGYTVEMVDHVPGVDDANVSMSVRQHAAALPWLDLDDILLVGDIDLLPIRRWFYHQNDDGKHELVIHHSSMYDDRYWPAYGPAMSVAAWREVMGLSAGDLMGSLLKTFREGNIAELIACQKADNRDSRLWFFDEVYASQKIRESRFAKDFLRANSTTKERLCRNSWPFCPLAADYIDCHCPRPGWSEDSWMKIRYILSQTMHEDLHKFDCYVAWYRGSLPQEKLF